MNALVAAMLGGAITVASAGGGTAEPSLPSSSPTPETTTTPSTSRPCADGSIASIADRPGVGRALTVNGSPCVAPPGALILEIGAREQRTRAAAGTSTLVTWPQPIFRWGIGAGNELIVAPSLDVSRRSGVDLGTAPFAPSVGLQDAGLGYKRQLQDHPWMQSAIEAFVTAPTGYPSGANGFGAGIVTALLGYSIVVPIGPVLGATSTQNVQWSAATNALGDQQGFASYQASFGVSLAVGQRAAFLVQDQITTPAGLGGGTSNRAFAGVQRMISPNVVLDVEYEVNALPPNGFSQHAFGGGAAIRL